MMKLLQEVQHLRHSPSSGLQEGLIAVLITVLGMVILLGVTWLAFSFIWNNVWLILVVAVLAIVTLIVATTRE